MFTQTKIAKLKHQARAIQDATGCKYMHALEQVAKAQGFNTWAALLATQTKGKHE